MMLKLRNDVNLVASTSRKTESVKFKSVLSHSGKHGRFVDKGSIKRQWM